MNRFKKWLNSVAQGIENALILCGYKSDFSCAMMMQVVATEKFNY